MDPVTQGLFGGLWAQAGSRRRDMRLALVTGTVAGMAPDLDVLIRSSSDSLLAIEYHRHFTHALAFIPVGALIVALILWPFIHRWRPEVKFARVYLWSLLGVASHGLLDAMTSYGTRLFWPFSDERVAWNIISVIDPLFSVPLAVLLAVGVWRRNRLTVRIAALWVIFYLAFGAVQQHRAEKIVTHWAEQQGVPIERALAKPGFANLVLWRGLVDDGERFHALAIRILPGRPAMVWEGSTVARYRPADVPAGTRLARDLDRFEHFSAGWTYRYFRYDTDDRAFIGDFRYAIDPAGQRPLWGILYDADDPAAGVRFERTSTLSEREREAFFARLRGQSP
ncbi:metal-dependent hydrolase [Wenzhouxiangella sp. XN79A]|uniref:metal-dependent hydrolase n=1 Tax=Wenzhouxiangella sp. XN79A TaxID=2724193 RepID=UPI00144AB570|nr:metal-dependent hydrolase [Wenzhouxiangella sp. XN79A]NKI36092.1 metal-dependent hydrolase [Wenzhouxiangella sp. XN79A]